VSIGAALLSITSNGELAATPPAPAPIPIIPNRDLRMIAATVLGDASRWTDLVSQNGLVYPFLSWPSGGAAASQSGLIPGTVAIPGALITATSGASQAIQDPAGKDLDPQGSEALVGGVQNIVNALMRRLNTPRGYLPHHPRYGSSLSKLLGSPLTVDLALAIRGEVSKVILSDPRVTSVTGVTLTTDDQGSIIVNATAQTILGPASFALVGGS
jgi:phage baseplate assembly protein W